ncbi:DUF2218 domain-containing protein [Microvirga pudoricolor]|uniref:DUF2218 domain-containing protein n=1 Tax=Microvirga pudoricolor TaxID=2778729 RepID=UPI00194E651B|nr:DUF2218 domain-containing protein [Microvirga pudoricolor]MBM6596139.1 DUF2218 domain-containing protein [Microvirga pudoricolor]
MAVSHTTIATASGSRYLQQLCNHWKHKFAVENTPEHGVIPFSDDRVCTLDATTDGLSIRIEAPDEESLERLQGVVIDHLKRFAFRENLESVRWERAPA